MPRRPVAHPWPVRLTHWSHVPLLALMAGSGLQIFVAYPFLGARGALYAWWPWQGTNAPSWMRLGGWLAGARHLHFAGAWMLLGNAAVYAVYAIATGAWRDRVFLPRRDARDALNTALGYLRIRSARPKDEGLYNGLQRLAYAGAWSLASAEVLSGLAIWKPVQLAPLAALFGGYDGARAVHLLALLGLLCFVAGHVLMVATHPRSLLEMITGARRR